MNQETKTIPAKQIPMIIDYGEHVEEKEGVDVLHFL